MHGEFETHAAVTLEARGEGITRQRHDVVRGGVPSGVCGFVNTGARRLLAGLEGFSHRVLALSLSADARADMGCAVRPRGATQATAALVAFAADPQPHFIFDKESLLAVGGKSGLELEGVGFERHVETPPGGDE